MEQRYGFSSENELHFAEDAEVPLLYEIVENALLATGDAEINFRGYDGSYYLFLSQEVVASGSTMLTTRVVREENDLIAVDGVGSSLPLRVSQDGRRIEGPSAEQAEGMVDSLQNDQSVLGRLAMTAIKLRFDGQPEYGSQVFPSNPVGLSVLVRRIRKNDTEQQLRIQVGLDLSRVYGQGEGIVRQNRGIFIDPNTGVVAYGDSISIVQGLGDLMVDRTGSPMVTLQPEEHKVPHIKAQDLQRRFQASTSALTLPLDQPPNHSQWNMLLKTPFTEELQIPIE